jgi:hypothetical protein
MNIEKEIKSVIETKLQEGIIEKLVGEKIEVEETPEASFN